MLKTWQAFYLSVFCVLAAVIENPHISFNTLKSDLDLILEDPDSETVNIQYAEGAVLHLSVATSPSTGQRYIRIDEFVSVKQKDGSVVEMSGLVYLNGSFGFSPDHEESLFFIIKQKPVQKIKPAKRTILYTPVEQLSRDLDVAKRGHEWTNEGLFYFCLNFTLGTSTNPLVNDMASQYLILTKPLKGITLLEPESKIETFFNDWYKPITFASKCGCPGGETLFDAPKRDHIYFDVWFKQDVQEYGSSSSSLGLCVDAVRVYDEWLSHVEAIKAAKASHDEVAEDRGEDIRRRTFGKDMHTAQMRLDTGTFMNVLINYADNIVLEVRAAGQGDDRHLVAMGTTKADARGRGPLNVRALYDSERLEYSDEIATHEFKPANLGDKSAYLKYTEWEKFESHLKAIWTAMQNGCTSNKQVYEFSIFYGDSIRVAYNCQTKNIVLDDTMLILTEVSDLHKSVITKCKTLQYLSSQKIETTCLDGGVTAKAIQQDPEKLWVEFNEPVYIDTTLFEEELKLLKEKLLLQDHFRYSETADGAIILDDCMLFELKLYPEEGKMYVEVHGNFRHTSMDTVYQSFLFNGKEFWTDSNGLKLNNIFTLQNNASFNSQLERQFVISSKHLTIQKLEQYFRVVSKEASNRCILSTKAFSFKFVFHYKFAFDGWYYCSEMVLRVQGNLKALLLVDKDGRTEVRPDRLADDLIYVVKDNLFITERGSLNDVFAISVPEITSDLEDYRELFGAPILMDKYAFLLLKKMKVYDD